MVANKSRAEYFKERRKSVKQLYVNLTSEQMKLLESGLREQGKTKTAWVVEKIHQDFGDIGK